MYTLEMSFDLIYLWVVTCRLRFNVVPTPLWFFSPLSSESFTCLLFSLLPKYRSTCFSGTSNILAILTDLYFLFSTSSTPVYFKSSCTFQSHLVGFIIFLRDWESNGLISPGSFFWYEKKNWQKKFPVFPHGSFLFYQLCYKVHGWVF